MRILRSTVVKFAALAVCYVSAFAALCSLNNALGHYVHIFFRLNLLNDTVPALFASVASFVLFCLSVWKSEPTTNAVLRRLNRTDFLLLALITVCAVFLCVYFVYSIEITGAVLLFFTLAAFAFTMALVAATISRVRDKTLKSTTCWVGFYKAYPIASPVGAATTVLLAGNLWIIGFNMVFCYLFRTIKTTLNSPAFIFAIITLAVLTSFCRFILSLAASYEKANEDKIKAERLKAELITNVSHDIRTPLTSIINYVDLIKGLPANDAVLTEYIGVLDKKSQRLKTLIGDLLEASKAGTGNVRVCLRAIDLAEIVGQIAGEFDGEFTDNRLTLIINFGSVGEENRLSVKADGDLLWRVVENIFGNAAKYALPGTRVYADAKIEGGTTCLTLKNVSKEPLNISPDELTERFIRGDSSRSGDGNGLGLYIARNLTQLMGGQFDIRISGDLFEASVVLTNA